MSRSKQLGISQATLWEHTGAETRDLTPRERTGGFLHIPPKRYISAQTARVELMGTWDNSWTIASKSMISGDFLNS